MHRVRRDRELALCIMPRARLKRDRPDALAIPDAPTKVRRWTSWLIGVTMVRRQGRSTQWLQACSHERADIGIGEITYSQRLSGAISHDRLRRQIGRSAV